MGTVSLLVSTILQMDSKILEIYTGLQGRGEP